MYDNKPCVGMTTRGKPLPPCIGRIDNSGFNKNNNRYGSNTNTNTNVNNIVIKMSSDNRIEIEKPNEN